MRNAPSNSDDIIDSRDIIERIEELQSERADLESAVESASLTLADALDPSSALATDKDEIEALQENLKDAREYLKDWDGADELKALLALQEEAEGYAEDWHHGTPLVRESYFMEYCQEMLEDMGDLPKNFPSYIVIDWDATADNLKMDYTEVDFDGVAYLVR
jgi:hypothetical protein